MTQDKRPDGIDVGGDEAGSKRRVDAAATKPHDVGAALRNAFKATVEEDVPSEMLDLLRRLD